MYMYVKSYGELERHLHGLFLETVYMPLICLWSGLMLGDLKRHMQVGAVQRTHIDSQIGDNSVTLEPETRDSNTTVDSEAIDSNEGLERERLLT